MDKVGLMIAQERVKKNMSKASLAKLVGCSTRAIEYWESDERGISLDNANKIFIALGVTIKIGFVSV